ncbi:MAG: hypothetical protein RLZZ507_579 [Cyanobacteriota bacterium]|jgi:hypothetical protein
MTQHELLNEFSSLPAEAQRQVIDFIAFLRQRYEVKPANQSQNSDLINDGFIGMWSERQDLTESNAWVRNVRKDEW